MKTAPNNRSKGDAKKTTRLLRALMTPPLSVRSWHIRDAYQSPGDALPLGTQAAALCHERTLRVAIDVR